MNMSDVRNTDQTQGFFWAIAIPVTACIVFAAVLLAYHGDKLYDAIVQALHQLREQRMRKKLAPAPLKPGRTWPDMLPLYLRFWNLRGRGGVLIPNSGKQHLL
jgi:hypothetical protein